jgi:hypothetical protein
MLGKYFRLLGGIYGFLITRRPRDSCALASPFQDMSINHRGFHVLMDEELLDRLIVVALSRKFVALVMFGFQTYLHAP